MEHSYKAGHPWYYVLGGIVRTPKQILHHVQETGYTGYLAPEIEQADRKVEPLRSEALRILRRKVLGTFRADLSRYREVVLQLHRLRHQDGNVSESPVCHEVHQSVSLKYNHLYNDLAHLVYVDALLAEQGDLFDL